MPPGLHLNRTRAPSRAGSRRGSKCPAPTLRRTNSAGVAPWPGAGNCPRSTFPQTRGSLVEPGLRYRVKRWAKGRPRTLRCWTEPTASKIRVHSPPTTTSTRSPGSGVRACSCHNQEPLGSSRSDHPPQRSALPAWLPASRGPRIRLAPTPVRPGPRAPRQRTAQPPRRGCDFGAGPRFERGPPRASVADPSCTRAQLSPPPSAPNPALPHQSIHQPRRSMGLCPWTVRRSLAPSASSTRNDPTQRLERAPRSLPQAPLW